MWAEAAVPRYTAVSQHVLGWGRGDKKQPNPVAVLQDLEADKPITQIGSCQRMHKEQGTAASSRSLDFDSERSSCPHVVPAHFHS